MSANDGERRVLPQRPSLENLRKQAKRRAKKHVVQLAQAQRDLALEYGFSDWTALVAHVREHTRTVLLSALAKAARDGDFDIVRRLVEQGNDPNDGGGDTSPLWEACASKAPAFKRLAIARTLLEAGADARKAIPGQRPLHAVAKHGPAELAELLIQHGAIDWEPNDKRRSPLDIARASRSHDRAALIELLDRPVVRDPSFRAAIKAIQTGAIEELRRLLEAEPRLLRERIQEPACYRASGRAQYFLDPKLFWFIANNPTLLEHMPANMPALAATMIERGVEKADLDYALGLTMTSEKARQNDLQLALVKVLIDAGAQANAESAKGALAHCETAAVEYLLTAGLELTAPIAAALSRTKALGELLQHASQAEIDEALDLAVINNRTEAVRMTLAAGANPNRRSSHHAHSEPLHQAALHDNVEILAMLIAHGARLGSVDALWGGTPLGWAMHGGQAASVAFLRARSS
jgi:ankyrin repeat protein